MEWMYKEQNENELSQQDQSNLSLDQNTAFISDDETNIREGNKSNLLDKDKMNVEPSLSVCGEDCTEDFFHPVGPPASSDSDEPVATDDFRQHYDSSANENSCETPIDERDTINDAENVEDGIVEFNQKIDEGVSECEKDGTINFLRAEVVTCHILHSFKIFKNIFCLRNFLHVSPSMKLVQIDMLRAKIQELESECVKKGTVTQINNHLWSLVFNFSN